MEGNKDFPISLQIDSDWFSARACVAYLQNGRLVRSLRCVDSTRFHVAQ